MKLKVFVAHKGINESARTQLDFDYSQRDGEIVVPPRGDLKCDHGFAEDDCGCHRSMVTMNNDLSTTMFKVAEIDMSEADFRVKVFNYLKNLYGGAGKAVKRSADRMADNYLKLAKNFPVGQPLKTRDSEITLR